MGNKWFTALEILFDPKPLNEGEEEFLREIRHNAEIVAVEQENAVAEQKLHDEILKNEQLRYERDMERHQRELDHQRELQTAEEARMASERAQETDGHFSLGGDISEYDPGASYSDPSSGGIY